MGVFKFNLRLPGQLYDAESGNFDNGHRVFQSGVGRYAQSDPLGLVAGINTYAYVGGDPISSADPSGLVKWHGEMYSFSAADGIGGGIYQFDLRSDCVDGKYAYVNVYATAILGGIGVKYSGSGSHIDLDDFSSTLDVDGLQGKFVIISGGTGFGRGPNKGGIVAGWSFVQLGEAYADFTAIPSPGVGYDRSAGFGAGRSYVWNREIKDCICRVP